MSCSRIGAVASIGFFNRLIPGTSSVSVTKRPIWLVVNHVKGRKLSRNADKL